MNPSNTFTSTTTTATGSSNAGAGIQSGTTDTGSYGPAHEQADNARKADAAAQECYNRGDNLGYLKEKASAAGHRLMEAMSSGKDESTRTGLQSQLRSFTDQLEAEVRQFTAGKQAGIQQSQASSAPTSAAAYTGMAGGSGQTTSQTVQSTQVTQSGSAL